MGETEQDFQLIFNMAMGVVEPGKPFEWVTNSFAPGTKYAQACEEVYNARESLCFRFGMDEEDADLERIMNALMDLEEELSRRMFFYGMKYAGMKRE